MVNLVLKHFERELARLLPYLNQVDAPVYQLAESGKIYKGLGQEKKQISISDQMGKAVYIRQLQDEKISKGKFISSCDQLYNVTAICRAVFYSFTNDVLNPDEVKSHLLTALRNIDFTTYAGSELEIKVEPYGASTNLEKIFEAETKTKYEGGQWPVLVAVDFNLIYQDQNCDECLTNIECYE